MRIDGPDRAWQVHQLARFGLAPRVQPPSPSKADLATLLERSTSADSHALASALQERARVLMRADGGPTLRAIFPKADRFDLVRLESAALRGELPLPERVLLVERSRLDGANASYVDEAGGTVLLARDLDPSLWLRAYAEEAGHHLDRWLGGPDSKGDEGAIFAQGLLEGAPLSPDQLARERADHDHGTLTLAGRRVAVEFWDKDYAGGGSFGANPSDPSDSLSGSDGVSGSSGADQDSGSDGASGISDDYCSVNETEDENADATDGGLGPTGFADAERNPEIGNHDQPDSPHYDPGLDASRALADQGGSDAQATVAEVAPPPTAAAPDGVLMGSTAAAPTRFAPGLWGAALALGALALEAAQTVWDRFFNQPQPPVKPSAGQPQPSAPAHAPGGPAHVDEKARQHILDGDVKGGGHRPGTGRPGKSEFPSGWSDDKIIDTVEDVANDPNSTRSQQGPRTIAEGTREGVDIRTVVDSNGRIVTGYPTNQPRNPP